MERKPVSYWRVVRRLGMVWALFPLVFALGFGGVGGYFALKSLQLAREGVTAQAEILDKRISTSRSSDGSTSRSYRVTYQFTPEGHSEPVVRSDSVSERRYHALQVGGQGEVVYLWHNPELASVDPRHERFIGILFGSVGLIAALVTLGLGIWMIRRKLSVLRALRRGEVREARVTGMRETNVHKNKERQYVLDWVDAKGATGSSMMDGFDRLSAYPEGSVIAVYVDPATGRGWWEEQI